MGVPKRLHTLLFTWSRVCLALSAPCPRVVAQELTDAGGRACSGERALLFDKEREGFARDSGTWQALVQYVGIAFQKPKMIKVG